MGRWGGLGDGLTCCHVCHIADKENREKNKNMGPLAVAVAVTLGVAVAVGFVP